MDAICAGGLVVFGVGKLGMLAQTACLGATAAYHAVGVDVGVCVCVCLANFGAWCVGGLWFKPTASTSTVDGSEVANVGVLLSVAKNAQT